MRDMLRDDVQGVLSTSSDQTDERIRRLVWAALAVLYLLVGMSILTFDTLLPIGDRVRFEVGDIPDDDIYAPESRTYESAVLTDQARREAAANAPLQYTRVSNISRDQLDLMRDIVAYMNMVVDDPYTTSAQKTDDLQAITALTNVEQQTWETIVAASDEPPRWSALTQEFITALQTTMSRDIYPTDASIDDALRSLQNRVNFDLSDADQQSVVSVVRPLIIPNNRLDEEATAAERAQAVAAVEPYIRTFRQGETIISKGRPIREEDIEALRIFGLQQGNRSNIRIFMSAFLLMLLVTGAQALYVVRYYPEIVLSPRLIVVLMTIFLLFLAVGRAFGPDWIDQQRLYPAAALSLLVAALVGPHLSMVMTASLALLVGTMFDNSLELIILIAVGGIASVLSLRDIERLNSYFSAGLVTGLVNVVIVLAFIANTEEETPNIISMLSQSSLAFANGLLAAAIALVGLFVIGAVANLTTSVKLIELMQPNQPLLQILLRKAPGTYQHSLQVANLAELAAERIGANASLIRVGAMYHDIGKTLNPQFFVENQAEGFNPHNELDDPYRSAQLIIGHVGEGERLARRHRLPQRIRDFIREHHGTMKPWYFYYQAIERAGGDETKIETDEFSYPGPVPQSKETAILLLADGTESTARAVRPRSHEEVAGVVNKIMEGALAGGQLDESNLTLNDLKTIREVFIETLQAIYHPRIAYREPAKLKPEASIKLEDPDTKPDIAEVTTEETSSASTQLVDTLPEEDEQKDDQ